MEEAKQAGVSESEVTMKAFAGFARCLGRVITYRALALNPEAVDSITRADNIFPSGALSVGNE